MGRSEDGRRQRVHVLFFLTDRRELENVSDTFNSF